VSAAPGQRWRSTYRGEDRVVLVLHVEPSLDRRGLVATVCTVWRAGRAVDGPTTRVRLDATGRLPRYRLDDTTEGGDRDGA
jgi:hypothetical protein